jgi:hypothetical protein
MAAAAAALGGGVCEAELGGVGGGWVEKRGGWFPGKGYLALRKAGGSVNYAPKFSTRS